MKHLANSKTALAGAIILSLAATVGAASGAAVGLMAGILGLAALGLAVTRPQPKLAPVRISTRKNRF